MSSRRTPRVVALAAVAALVLLAGGAVCVVAGQRLLGILAIVLGLACVRVCTWWLKARALTQVGLDLARGDDAT